MCPKTQGLAPPGMEMHQHKVAPSAFLTCSCLTCTWALAVGPGANHRVGDQTSYSSGWSWPRETSSHPAPQ